MARCAGSPVSRSHTTVVSRWFVIPIAAMADASIPAFSTAPRIVSTVVRHRSSGSCSTQPDRGKCWGNSRWSDATARRSASKTIDRVDVVPWSMARM